jgi:type IV pilus assembly protein PilV
MNARALFDGQHGTSLIEVLVTILILSFGLLGLAGLQSRMHLAEMESYQRAQALILMDDMASRIAVNRGKAAEYADYVSTIGPVGAGMTCPTDPATRPEIDAVVWCNALQGAAEVTAANNDVGAVVGGRGCVEALPDNEYMVTVAWQGLTPVAAPPASVTCGQNQYDDAASKCTADRCRRVVTTIVRVGPLN